MKVLVTGAAGFIASNVVDGLVVSGADVVGIDSLDPGVYDRAPGYLNPKASYCFSDLRSLRPDERFDDVEVLLHFAALGGVGRAAREPGNVIEANVAGTARLVDAIGSWRHLERVVLASSFSVYGSGYRYRCQQCGDVRSGDRRTEDLDRGQFEVTCDGCGSDTEILQLDTSATPAPLEVYGASKLMQELCFQGFSACPVHLLRQSSVYGPRLRLDDGEATIIARIAGWVSRGVPPPLFEDGRQLRDWVAVRDIVDAVVAILNGADAPAVLNVCTGVPTRLDVACEVIADALGTSCPPEVVGGFRPGDMRHCLGDPAEFSKLLGREPTPLAVGVEQWFAAPS